MRNPTTNTTYLVYKIKKSENQAKLTHCAFTMVDLIDMINLSAQLS